MPGKIVHSEGSLLKKKKMETSGVEGTAGKQHLTSDCRVSGKGYHLTLTTI